MIKQLSSAIGRSPATAHVDPQTIATVLSNPRRCRVIDVLSRECVISLGDLADKVAALEYGRDYSTDERKCVYVAIYQNHLDVLEEHDVVEAKQNGVKKGSCFAAYESALEAIRNRSTTGVGGNGVRTDSGDRDE